MTYGDGGGMHPCPPLAMPLVKCGAKSIGKQCQPAKQKYLVYNEGADRSGLDLDQARDEWPYTNSFQGPEFTP